MKEKETGSGCCFGFFRQPNLKSKEPKICYRSLAKRIHYDKTVAQANFLL